MIARAGRPCHYAANKLSVTFLTPVTYEKYENFQMVGYRDGRRGCRGRVTVIKAQATPAARRFAQRHGALVARVKEQLGLTDEQLGRIRAELRLEKETLTGLLKRLRSTRAELRDTIQQQGATEEMVRAASAKVAEVEADMAVER